MEIHFIPIDYDYFDWQERNYIKIIGRLENGKKACIIDNFEPYFWVVLKSKISDSKIKQIREKIEKIQLNDKIRTSKVIKTELHDKNFLGKPVKAIKVFITNYKDAHAIADEIGMKEVNKRRGYDLNYITQYIIEKKLKPLTWYKIKGELIDNNDFGGINNLDVDIVLKVNGIEEIPQKNFSPKILAYDIEANELEIGKGEILMISLVGQDFKKVLTWKKSSNQKYVETFKDETDMLEAFVKYVKQYGPDILVGYFSDGFDLPYLRARAEKNNTRLSLGIDNSQPVFSRGKLLTGKIKGIVHIDLLRFIKNAYSQYLQSETLGLNEVASELLGEKKIEFSPLESANSIKPDWEKFFEYNLQDSVLTYKLIEKAWPDLLEITKIVNEPLFNISRNTMASNFEDLVIHNLNRFNEISEKRPTHDEIGKRRILPKYEGAFVFQPTPGLYEKIGFFDFSSMYASVIVSYNLSSSSLTKQKKDSYESIADKKKVYFSKIPQGFIPSLLAEIIDKRRQFKEEYNKNPNPISKARSNAFKLIANAAYGYQGFFGARYYCREAAASTAYFAKQNIKKAIEIFEKSGFKVTYSDTDSIAITLGNKTEKQSLEVLEEINKNLPGIMELDYEGLFKRGIWVTKRTGDFGAKKKYALIDEKGKIKIRGFETVRRDWCFPPDTNVLVKDGVKFIKDLKKNDFVLTHKGKFKKINIIHKREYRGKLIKILPYYLPKIEVTPEHPMLAIKTKKCSYQSNTICKKYCKKENQSCKKHHQLYEKKWVKASELSPGDFLLCPIIRNTKKIKFNIIDFLDSKKFLIEKGFIRNIKESYSAIRIPSQKLNEKLAYLFGLYIAEGYATDTYHGYIRFAFNKKERKLIEKLTLFMKDLFNIKPLIIQRDSKGRENVIEVVFYSKILGSLFKNLFGSKADGKKLPSWILELPKKYQIALVRGMFDGDGSYKNIRFRGIVYTTVSKNLAFQFQSILLRLGLISSLKISKFYPSKIGMRDIITKNKCYSIIISGKQLEKADKLFDIHYLWVKKRSKTYQHGYVDKSYAYIPIKKIDKKDYRGFVYNLRVEEDNSYTVNSIAVHNCTLARETQNKVLQLILQDGNEKKALEYVKQIIKQIKNREINLKEILIRTQLKKPIEEYKSINPHVTIAKRMKELEMPVDIGMLIEYYISEPENHQKTKTGKTKALVRERAKLPSEKGEYDIEYYLNHQILPAVENIFEVFNVNINEVIDGKKQTKLGEF